jgi:proteic killer suppression protein
VTRETPQFEDHIAPEVDTRNVPRYTRSVIKSFEHKGLQAFFESGSKAGIQPHHAARLARQLAQLDASNSPSDMNVPGWRMHALTGDLKGQYAVTVSGNWRLTFAFEGSNAILVDYQDYH